jgi:predicted metal-dependent phosphoesterase TrpH
MKYKIDLHVHSKNSGDNSADPEENIERAIERGLDGIAFTEHYSFEASEPAERLKEKYDAAITIFRGVEFSAAEGHCLIFGVDTDRLSIKHAPVREIVRVVNHHGGVVIPSHPYRGGNSMGDLLFELPGITAVEGCNGVNMHAMNVRAMDAAGKLNLPYTGGSDAHEPNDVGSCYTEFDDKVTEGNFIEMLKAGRYRGVDTRKISRMLMP